MKKNTESYEGHYFFTSNYYQIIQLAPVTHENIL